MTNIDFENKHPRQDGGKFASKEGEAANVTLAAPATEPVRATIVHQVWQGDYAVETGETSDFDARPVLDSMTLEDLRDLQDTGDLYTVQEDATAKGHAVQPDGPSYTDIPGLDEYVEWREENGLTDVIAPLAPSVSRIDDDVKALLAEARASLSVSIAVQASDKEGFRRIIGTNMQMALDDFDDLPADTKERMRAADRQVYDRIRSFVGTHGMKVSDGSTSYRSTSYRDALEVVAHVADYENIREDERPGD